jgi:hypothetical protein
MTHMAAEMAKKTGEKSHAQQASSEDNGQSTALAGRYRQIGISAVAAAVRYQGVAKNPAYAPAPIKWQHTDEAAA